MCIRDIIQNGMWNLNLLYTTLPQNITHHIAGMDTALNPHIKDCIMWHGHPNGAYTANSSYKWLTNQLNVNSNASDNSWTWIWKAHIPEKIKILLWIACHNSLPSVVVLNHRGIIPSPICSRCNAPVKDILHMLRYCPRSHQLWRALKFEAAPFFNSLSVAGWLKEGVTGKRAALPLQESDGPGVIGI